MPDPLMTVFIGLLAERDQVCRVQFQILVNLHGHNMVHVEVLGPATTRAGRILGQVGPPHGRPPRRPAELSRGQRAKSGEWSMSRCLLSALCSPLFALRSLLSALCSPLFALLAHVIAAHGSTRSRKCGRPDSSNSGISCRAANATSSRRNTRRSR